jgi:hypothetical protein
MAQNGHSQKPELEGRNMSQKKGISAWVMTWETTTTQGKGKKRKLAAVLHYRHAGKAEELAKFLYANRELDVYGQLAYANGKPPEHLEYESIDAGYIYGENPHLWIRPVKNLRVVTSKSGKEKLAWDDPEPKPSPARKIFQKDAEIIKARQHSDS